MSAESRQYFAVRSSSLVFAAAIVVLAIGAMVKVWPTLRTNVLATSPCGCQAIIVPVTPVQQIFSWSIMLTAGVLMVTLIIGLATSFIRQHRFHRHQRRQLLRQVLHSSGVSYSIFPAEQPQAFTLGFFHPQIYLSTALLAQLTKSEVTAVLQHERAHQRAHDPLTATALDGLGRAWRWMPWIKLWVSAAASLRELTADAAATANYHHAEALAGAVTKLFEPSPVALAAFSPNVSRVEKLLDHHWQPAWRLWRWQYITGAASLALALILVIQAKPAKAETPIVVQRACHETQSMCRAVEQKALQSGLCLGANQSTCLNLPESLTTIRLIDASAAPLQP